MLGHGAWEEPTVKREVAGLEAQRVDLLGGRREKVGLVGRPDLRRGGQDQAPGAAAGVLAQLGDLHDVAKLGRRPELSLADRARVGIGEGDEAVGDLLAGDALADLAAHLLGALGQLVETAGSLELGLRAAAPRALTQPHGQAAGLADRLLDLLAGLPGQL